MLVRRVARPLLASIFIAGGVNALRDTPSHAKNAAPVVDQTVGKVQGSLPEQLPTDAETLVRVDGAVKIGAGALLALGKFPRLSSAVLSASLSPRPSRATPSGRSRTPSSAASSRRSSSRTSGCSAAC